MRQKYSGIWWIYFQSCAFTSIMKFETRSVLCFLFFFFFLLMWKQIFFTHLLLFNVKFYLDQILSNLAADEYFTGCVCRACCASLSSVLHGLSQHSFARLGLSLPLGPPEPGATCQGKDKNLLACACYVSCRFTYRQPEKAFICK